MIRRRWSRVFALVLGIGEMVFSSPAARAEPSPAEIATARRLFTEAAELRSAGKWSEAASRLRDAIAIKETAGLRFHLAHCEEQDGRLVSAARDYDRADELIRGGAKADDVAALLAPARVALAERVPSLLIKVPADVKNAEVSIDGSPLAPAAMGRPLPLDPGPHTVDAAAFGRTPFKLEVRLAEGEDRVVQATFARLPPTSPASPAAAHPVASRREAPSARSSSSFGAREVLLIGEGALALGGAAVGVVFLVQRGQASDRVDETGRVIGSDKKACANPQSTLAVECSGLQDALDERQKDGTIATVGFIGAGVGLVGAAFTWLLWPASPTRETVAVGPVPGGVVVKGAF